MIQKIVIIGSGNVATHLAKNLSKAGLSILQIYSRQLKNAKQLADQIDTPFCSHLSEINPRADLYLMAISDDAIPSLALSLRQHLTSNPKAIIAHTSGATSLQTLNGSTDRYGIFYPLQTFSKSKNLDLNQVPFCIDGNSKAVRKDLFELAKRLSKQVQYIDDEQRAILHVAAVFANNFSNYMFSIAADILAKNNLDFAMLIPLIEETAKKIQTTPPYEAQTGPARRGDQKTIQKHLNFLQDGTTYENLYKLISAMIMEKYKS